MISFVDFCDADFVTHSGRFHADEVMATAILLKIREAVLDGRIEEGSLPEVLKGKFNGEAIRLCRIPMIPQEPISGKLIYDLGGGKFDHHQENRNGKRSNGIYYAAVGLIWKEFGQLLVSPEIQEELDERLIQAIDCGDNGQFPIVKNKLPILNLDALIGSFNPLWNDNQGIDFQNQRFAEAVDFAYGILDRVLHKIEAEYAAIPVVEDALAKSEDGIIVLDRYVSWESTIMRLSESNDKARSALLVVYPSNRDVGAYIVQSPRDDMCSRLYLPEEWRGKRDEELNDLVEGGMFCHASGFMAVADSREHAIAMARIAINSK